MSLASFMSFDGLDVAAFLVCGVIGFFAGTFVPLGPPAIYTSILVSYHLFLAWLILGSNTAQKKAGVSLPVVHTAITHAACLLVILTPIAGAIASHSIPALGAPPAVSSDPITMAAEMEAMQRQRNALHLFQALCSSMAGLAIFERRWLFSAEKAEPSRPKEVPAPSAPAIQATAEDAAEWSRYLAQRPPGSRKPGVSLKAEYEQWLAARHKE